MLKKSKETVTAAVVVRLEIESKKIPATLTNKHVKPGNRIKQDSFGSLQFCLHFLQSPRPTKCSDLVRQNQKTTYFKDIP